MDRYLLEAMREVDAMLPNSPPIAPCDCESCRRGISHNSGAYLMLNVSMERMKNELVVGAAGQTFVSREVAEAMRNQYRPTNVR